MIWKIGINIGGGNDIEDYTVMADNIDDAEKKALRECEEYHEDESFIDSRAFIVVNAYLKIK